MVQVLCNSDAHDGQEEVQHYDNEQAPAAYAGSDHPQACRGPQVLAAGKDLTDVCRHLEIAESSWHRWLAQYGGMKASDAKRLTNRVPLTRCRESCCRSDHRAAIGSRRAN